MTEVERKHYNDLWTTYVHHTVKPEYGGRGPKRSVHHQIWIEIKIMECRPYEPCNFQGIYNQ